LDLPIEAYSMEDAKLRSGVDAKRATAEEVKERVRKSVKVLRKEYQEAVRMNDALPVEVLYAYVFLYGYFLLLIFQTWFLSMYVFVYF
jgi:hypothetical protein